MTNERFIEINMEEGLSRERAERLLASKPERISLETFSEETVREKTRRFLPFLLLTDGERKSKAMTDKIDY